MWKPLVSNGRWHGMGALCYCAEIVFHQTEACLMRKSITVYVNGDLVNKGTNCSVEEGAICLQSERADVQFRGIRLRALRGRVGSE